MSKIDLLFYGSAALCVLSFLLFCYEVIVHVRRTARPPAPRATGDEARPEAFDAREAMQEMRSLVSHLQRLAPSRRQRVCASSFCSLPWSAVDW